MIVLTRLDGSRCAINDEQIERIDETPTTVLLLLNGNSYSVLESVDEVIDRITAFRSRVFADVASEGRAPVVPLAARPSITVEEI